LTEEKESERLGERERSMQNTDTGTQNAENALARRPVVLVYCGPPAEREHQRVAVALKK